MPTLKVNLKNCYGIKKLEYEFGLNDDCRTCIIYAPNGVMKTCFAKTINDYAVGRIESKDVVFNREPYQRSILDEHGKDYSRDGIFVISSYVDTRFASDKISNLVVRDELREKYEVAITNLTDTKKPIINSLASNTRSSDCEKEILRTFPEHGDNFFDVIEQIIDDLRKNKDAYPVYTFRYNDIFDNSSVANFIKNNAKSIELYHAKYFEILEKSDGFFAKDGSFGTFQASSIAKSVSDDAFFRAGHKFLIKDQNNPLDSSSEFMSMIDEAKSKVLSDPELKVQFDKIDSSLSPNTLTPLRKLVGDDKSILLELLNYQDFQTKYWKGQLAALLEELEGLMRQYLTDKKVIDDIIKEANDESVLWKETIRIFKSRFIDLPFEVDIEDKKDAVLGLKQPKLEYTFVDRDTGERKLMPTDELTDFILSNGEKRAFYLLNVIFEIQSRLHSDQESLFVIDDIADSFDYKNKFAIVEYLNDISKEGIFSSIILTHNFDFYRTATLRLKVKDQNRLFAQKEVDHISLVNESYACPMDPFKKWKNSLGEVQILALIPFVRNLIEYGRNDPGKFLKLTALLHRKAELKYECKGKVYTSTNIGSYDETNGDFTVSKTDDILYDDIEAIYKEYLGIARFPEEVNGRSGVSTQLIRVADSLDNSSLLENKIVLAIAIRHVAEKYMILKINNPYWINKISGSQTSELFQKFRNKVGNGDIPESEIDHEMLELLERVNIITPENIHINSFMYEPIVDMCISELKTLYQNVKLKLS